MTASPQDPAARPAFAGLLLRLRGGEGQCPKCRDAWHAGCGLAANRCDVCKGKGRVAVPPDPHPELAGQVVADWWSDQGGDLAGLLVVYAGLAEPCPVKCAAAYLCPRCGGSGELPDPCLSHALAAWDDALCPARAAAVRGLGLTQTSAGLWCVAFEGRCPHVRLPPSVSHNLTEPAAKLALKRATLICYDPGNPYDGGAGVRVPMRAEGARLTVRHGTGPEFEIAWRAWKQYDSLTQGDAADVYHLDGVRVGAPPEWSWTPHALPCVPCEGTGRRQWPESARRTKAMFSACGGSGRRLAVTWDAAPSSLLPAAGAEFPSPRVAHGTF